MSFLRSSKEIAKRNWQWWLILSFLVLLPTKNLFNLPVGIMTITGLVMMVRRWKALRHDRGLHFLLVLFGCFWIPMTLSLADAVNIGHSAKTTLSYLRFLPMGVFFLESLREERMRRHVFLGVLVIVVMWCADALWQLATAHNVLGFPIHGSRLTGIFHPRYRLGIVLAALLPLYLELVRQLLSRSVAAWLLVPPTLIVIILNGTRSAWLMMMLGLAGYLVYLAFRDPRVFSLRSLLMASAVAVLIIFAASHFPPLANRAQALTSLITTDWEAIDIATQRRVSIWVPGVDMAKSHWLNGVGPRGFRYAFLTTAPGDNFWMKRDPPGVTHQHLHGLEVVSETGILGLAGYGLAFVIFFRMIRNPRAGAALSTPLILCALVVIFPLNAHVALYASFWSSVIWWLISLGLATYSGEQ